MSLTPRLTLSLILSLTPYPNRFWTDDIMVEKEIVGPFASKEECIAAAVSEAEPTTMARTQNLILVELLVQNDKFIKVRHMGSGSGVLSQRVVGEGKGGARLVTLVVKHSGCETRTLFVALSMRPEPSWPNPRPPTPGAGERGGPSAVLHGVPVAVGGGGRQGPEALLPGPPARGP